MYCYLFNIINIYKYSSNSRCVHSVSNHYKYLIINVLHYEFSVHVML